jgi:hypothetical protein
MRFSLTAAAPTPEQQQQLIVTYCEADRFTPMTP